MPRFVALLRGVNVGKGHRVPMAGLKLLLETWGCTDVKTLLNSGNATFTSSNRSAHTHAQKIAHELQATFGVTTPVIVKSAAEFSAIVSRCPIVPPEPDHPRFLVAFAMSNADLHTLEPLARLVQPPEQLVITDHAAYLHCPNGLLNSKLGEAVLGKAGRSVTTRNWSTVLKLGAQLGAA